MLPVAQPSAAAAAPASQALLSHGHPVPSAAVSPVDPKGKDPQILALQGEGEAPEPLAQPTAFQA